MLTRLNVLKKWLWSRQSCTTCIRRQISGKDKKRDRGNNMQHILDFE